MPNYYIQRYTIDVAVPVFGFPINSSKAIGGAIGAIPDINVIDIEVVDDLILVEDNTVKLSENAGTPAKKEVA
jgi:hypothetical protein